LSRAKLLDRGARFPVLRVGCWALFVQPNVSPALAQLSERNNVTSLFVDEGGSARSLISWADVSLSGWRPVTQAQRYGDVSPIHYLKPLQSFAEHRASGLSRPSHLASSSLRKQFTPHVHRR